MDFPAIDRVAKNLNAMVADGLDHVDRAIDRAVVDDDDFIIRVEFVENRPQLSFNIQLALIGCHANTQAHSRRLSCAILVKLADGNANANTGPRSAPRP